MALKPMPQNMLSVLDEDVTFLDTQVVDEASESDIENDDEPIDLDEAVDESRTQVESAVSFIESEMFPDWERAENFFDGASDVPTFEGRSQVTQTVMMDAVRALKPSVMRVFLQAGKIGSYMPFDPTDPVASAIAEAQTAYANQIFWRYGGYRALLDTTHTTFLKNAGILKACYEKKLTPIQMTITDLTEDDLDDLAEQEGVKIIEERSHEIETGDMLMPVLKVYEADIVWLKPKKVFKYVHVPAHEFFIDEDATCPDDATVVGQRRSVTVSEARSMGLPEPEECEYSELDDLDLEDQQSGESNARRGHSRGQKPDKTLDPSQHKFLLTEAYLRFDLDGIGVARLYRFWLGGTDYKYIHHEPVDENPYAAAQHDPMPGSFFGKSIYDVLAESQNTGTSLLRATCDNAHLSNNQRLAVHETMVNMADVLNTKLGAPIRFRQPGMVQPIGVQPMVSAMLPLLEKIESNAENKVGITNASMGLDPDALQSTDKDAVRNTIELAQSQVEFMVRNIAETGVIPMMQKMLRLQIQHGDNMQTVSVNGQDVQVDIRAFDPNMEMYPNVGLGNDSKEQHIQMLMQIKEEQKMVMAEYGPDNPYAGADRYANTVSDIVVAMGGANVSRYFAPMNPQMMQQLGAMKQQMMQAQQPPDPTAALTKIEEIKQQGAMATTQMKEQGDMTKAQMQQRQKIIDLMMRDDLERDKMAQQLEIEAAKLTETMVDKQAVREQQGMDRQLTVADKALTHMEKFKQMSNQQQPQQGQQAPMQQG